MARARFFVNMDILAKMLGLPETARIQAVDGNNYEAMVARRAVVYVEDPLLEVENIEGQPVPTVHPIFSWVHGEGPPQFESWGGR